MNFYKITNKEENHNSLQYKTGLNIDPLPWNPNGDCEPGGIYFSREDILAFVEHGPWIRKVTVPENIEVYKNPGKPKKWKAREVILGKRRKININVIKGLLEEGADIHADDDHALKWASQKGYLETIKLLLEYGANVHAQDDFALIWAGIHRRSETIQLLLGHGANAIKCFKWASRNGHTEVINLLLKHGASQ